MNKYKENKINKTYQQYEYLDERLAAYAESDYYPFHMPGHKRRNIPFDNPFKIDITEIEGFDHLHYASDFLLKSQERLKHLYHTKKSYYLVNGSTCGLLSAVGALVKPGDNVIIARNCHKAVYNAVKIFCLKADYVYPKLMECGIQGQIEPDEVEIALEKNPNTKIVVITSPTYDGIVSNIKKIAEITKKYNSYLIVDEAHGAHFSLSGFFPESAVRQGADIVVQSLHKTLPSFTQTAALHIAGETIDCKKVEDMLCIFQSSSPSYVLMAGIEKCVKILEQSGKDLFEAFQKRLECFYEECRQLKNLHVLTAKDYEAYHVYAVDQSKILISTLDTTLNGKILYQILLEKYHLQMEMYSAQYVLAMTSIMDTQEGFDRLLTALLEIDQMNQINQTMPAFTSKHCHEKRNRNDFLERAYAVRKKVMEISDIDSYSIEKTALEKSAGKTCAECIYLYPPGIPMILPGEIISEEFIFVLEECRKMKRNVQGIKDTQCHNILTVAYTSEKQL